MPPPQEARQRTQNHRIQEPPVRRIEPQFRQIDEREGEGETERESGGDGRENAEGRRSYETARSGNERFGGDRDSASGQICNESTSSSVPSHGTG